MTRQEPLYIITEAELAKRCGMTPAEWSVAIHRLEAAGFPQLHPIFGKRLRAKVDRWFLAQADGNIPMPPSAHDGLENWTAGRRGRRDT